MTLRRLLLLLATSVASFVFHGPAAQAVHPRPPWGPGYGLPYGAPPPTRAWPYAAPTYRVANPYLLRTAHAPPVPSPAKPVTPVPAGGAGDGTARGLVPRPGAADPGPGAPTAPAVRPAAVPRAEVTDIPESLLQLRDPEARKRAFVDLLLPLVLLENERLKNLRHEVRVLDQRLAAGEGLGPAEERRLRTLGRDYRVDGNPVTSGAARRALAERVDIIPVSLALAQAANESAWGRSRFAREGRNLFGIWTYDATQGIVPRRRGVGQKHLVRRFDSLRESVRYYMHTLNSHPAYEELRRLRAQQRADGQHPDGHALAAGLVRYSAKGEEYVRIIREMMAHNDLVALDQARLTPGKA